MHSTTTKAPVIEPQILIVDDQQINRLILRARLEANGCIVTEAENGAEAVTLCRWKEFDLVFMDFDMPVLGGIEATLLIRDALHGAGFSPEILGFTDSGSTDRHLAAMLAGMNSIVGTSISRTVLHNAIDRAAQIHAARVTCQKDH